MRSRDVDIARTDQSRRHDHDQPRLQLILVVHVLKLPQFHGEIQKLHDQLREPVELAATLVYIDTSCNCQNVLRGSNRCH